MKVETLMSKSIAACHPSDSLAIATRMMWDHDLGFLPVTDENARLVGAITDRDIAMSAYMNDRPLSDISVAHVMARHITTCQPEEEVSEVEQLMISARVRRIPVVGRDGQLRGVLSITDLARGATNPQLRDGVRPADVLSALAAIGTPRHGGRAPSSGDARSHEQRV